MHPPAFADFRCSHALQAYLQRCRIWAPGFDPQRPGKVVASSASPPGCVLPLLRAGTAPCRTKPERSDHCRICCATLPATHTKVRRLAVCTAWRRYLDVRAWPLESLYLSVYRHRPLAEWIVQCQPGTRSFGLRSQLLDPLASNALLSLAPQVRWADAEGRIVRAAAARCV